MATVVEALARGGTEVVTHVRNVARPWWVQMAELSISHPANGGVRLPARETEA